ncbi:hypothetical protein MON38_06225 [Hymenobacter sp. DH14]|uniref:Uncharacterized protein n=1 Tax=Hymenobacter cyanobacteriorum TaxID=2926463 RepID=A0A9X1VF96_9BACT|nr:hypothetical protein [Hymenobacter cyanobacteriorum]MCI1187008.1 hypothetical protein [Hymenobacter cyanobacteriorum]
MKCLFALVLVATLCGGNATWQTRPARHVGVGAYYYDIKLKTQYDHDDEADNTYFVVTRAKSRMTQCSAILRTTSRKGAEQTTGEYAIEGQYLRFKERHFTPRRVVVSGRERVFPDSTVNTFSPDRTGQLHLVESWEYTGGKVERWRWVITKTTARKVPL